MAKFILVRHGEAKYDQLVNAGFKGQGLALAPLTEKGIKEVEKTAKNEIFKNSDLLIASPYTRTMQTASIIGGKYNLSINVELLLHEWIPDLTNSHNTQEEFLRNIKIAKREWQEYQTNKDIIFNDKIESIKHVRERALSVLEKYENYGKVIVVTHGLLISTLFKEKIRLHTGDFIEINSEQLNQIKEYKK